jgi:hypothetical protein
MQPRLEAFIVHLAGNDRAKFVRASGTEDRESHGHHPCVACQQPGARPPLARLIGPGYQVQYTWRGMVCLFIETCTWLERALADKFVPNI